MIFIVKPLQIFWQNFYKNVSWIVLYLADDFAAKSWFWLLPWQPKCKKEEYL